ncbi:MAG: DUF4091 domain-containing protein, partial [Candidatus Hydrogenedentes bacterium]|nr:DUF4091 domain-containing protein [Candidatus Hydrogenedentota bacterium]
SVKTSFDSDTGALRVDADAYDADLEALIDGYGFRNVCLPRALLGSQRTLADSYLSTGHAVGSDAFWPLHDTYLTGMGDYYRSRGRAHNVVYCMMDEIQPELQEVAAGIGRSAKQHFPEVKVLLTTHEMPDHLAGALDIWCVPWHFFATRPEAVHRWDALRARGLTLWTYMNSLYILNADWNPGALRLFPAVIAKYGYSGALWWQLRYYGDGDPWAQGLATMTDSKRNRRFYGSGYLIYPPREGETGWHSSLRWENYRQGLDEYELMALLRARWEDVARALGPAADEEAFSADHAMRWWGSMLSHEFRVQTFRRDTAYIHRFRQLIANEIKELGKPPLALIDCEPDEACGMTSDTLHIRGLCAAGTEVEVAGRAVGQSSEEGAFVFTANERLGEGVNLIPIRLSDRDGNSKVLYREVACPATAR